MRAINYRLLLAVLTIAVIVLPAIYFLHRFQLERQSGIHLEHAKHAKEEGNLSEAIEHLSKYTEIAVGDTDALDELGALLTKAGKWNEAFPVLEQVLRRDPGRVDARRSLAETLMALGRYTDAKEELDRLVVAGQDDAEVQLLLAACLGATGQWQQAASACETAIDKDPAQLIAYQQLANIQRKELEELDASEVTIDNAVKANSELSEAYVVRGNWRLRFRQDRATLAAVAKDLKKDQVSSEDVIAQAQLDAAEAIKLAPNAPAGYALAASVAMVEQDYAAARKQCDRAIELDEQNIQLLAMRAQIEAAAGDVAASVRWLKKANEVSPQDLGLIWALAGSLLDQGKHEEAQLLIERLGAEDFDKSKLKFLRARQAVAKEQWTEGIAQLEACLSELVATPELAKQGYFLLGSCYKQLRRPTEQIAALKRAVDIDPNWVPARQQLAAALAGSGRADEAADHLRQAAKSLPTGNSSIAEIRRLIQRNRELAKDRQNWTQVLGAIEKEASASDSPPLWIAKAQVYVVQEKPADATKVLEDALVKYPQSEDLWLSLILLDAEQKAWDAARTRAEKASKAGVETLRLRLLLARIIAQQGNAEWQEELLALAVPPPSFGARDKTDLRIGIAELLKRRGDVLDAKSVYMAAAQEDPNSLTLQMALFDFAFDEKDAKAMEKSLAELKRIDGNGPYWKYGEALRLCVQAGVSNDKQLFAQAESLLLVAKQELSTLRQIPLLLGRINDWQSDSATAAGYYLEAINAGERDPAVIERTLALLFQQHRVADLGRAIEVLEQEQAPLTDGMLRVMAEYELRRGKFDRAVKYGQELVSRSHDYREHLWLGQALAKQGAKKEAELRLRAGVELANQQPDAWMALIRFLAESGQKQAMEEAILETQRVASSLPLAVTIAESYSIVGDKKSASDKFDAILTGFADSPDAWHKVALFRLNNDQVQEAKPLLEALLMKSGVSDELVRWSRRNLALILASKGTAAELAEARQLLEQNLVAKEVQDQRALAQVLVTTGDTASRQQAIAILEAIDAASVVNDDKFLLAQLYYRRKQFDVADKLMRDLIAAAPQESVFTQKLVEELLKRQQVAEADVWLNRLKKANADQLPVVRLDAEKFYLQQNYSQLVQMLKQQAKAFEGAPDSKQRLYALAGLVDSFQVRLLRSRGPSAETGELSKLSRALLLQSVPDGPQKKSLLTLHAAKRGDIGDALQNVEEYVDDLLPDQLALIGSAIMVSGLARESDLVRLTDLVVPVLQKHPTSTMLQMLHADLLGRTGKSAQAIEAYRQVIRNHPDSIVAANNLAVLLALSKEEGAYNEALKLIDGAIAKTGKNSTLLDTRAMIQISNKRYEDAILDAQKSIDVQESAAAFFHLACAYSALDQTAAAKTAYKNSVENGLSVSLLHPLEAPAFQKLQHLKPIANQN